MNLFKKTQGEDKTCINQAIVDARGGIALVAVFSFFLNLLYLVSPIYMLQVYDRVLASGSRDTLLYLTLIAVVALAVFGVFEATRTALLARIGSWLHDRIAKEVLETSLQAGIDGTPAGAQPLRDLKQLQGFLSSAGVGPFLDAPWVPVFVIGLWFLHPWLGILAIFGAIILFGIALANELVTRTPIKDASAATTISIAQAEQISTNFEAVHSMGMLPALLDRWAATNSSVQERNISAAERGGWLTGTSRFFRMSIQVGVLGLGALLVLLGDLSAGSMIAGSILLGRALAPVEQSIGAWRNFVSARLSFVRLQQLLRRHSLDAEPMELPAPKGHLQVDRIFVKAPNRENLILSNVQFEIRPGEAVAVIGPSASGKTTLCRTICGVLKPVRGAVRLDGAEVAHWPRSQFGKAVGYLPQTVELFPGTIKDNIARMQDAKPEDVVHAAQMADIHEMILGLPQGYDTEIGQNGVVLSGGQKQRLGLARALFGNPKLVVLDEPNSNLDQAGEQALAASIQRAKKAGAAVLIVAHRQSVIGLVDHILALKNGTVDIWNTRDEVIRVMRERQQAAAGPTSNAAVSRTNEGLKQANSSEVMKAASPAKTATNDVRAIQSSVDVKRRPFEPKTSETTEPKQNKAGRPPLDPTETTTVKPQTDPDNAKQRYAALLDSPLRKAEKHQSAQTSSAATGTPAPEHQTDLQRSGAPNTKDMGNGEVPNRRLQDQFAASVPPSVAPKKAINGAPALTVATLVTPDQSKNGVANSLNGRHPIKRVPPAAKGTNASKALGSPQVLCSTMPDASVRSTARKSERRQPSDVIVKSDGATEEAKKSKPKRQRQTMRVAPDSPTKTAHTTHGKGSKTAKAKGAKNN